MQPYYDHAGITIFNADCIEAMATLPDASIDAVITDPPYGTTACSWDTPIPFAPMWEQLKRITRPRGAIVLFGSQPFTSALVMSNPAMFRYDWVWEKVKATGHLNAARRPMRQHENILVFGDGGTVYNPQGIVVGNFRTGCPAKRLRHSIYGQERHHTHVSTIGNFPKTIIRIEMEYPTQHPTQKPLTLLSYLIRTYTNPGDTVLDFTVGSGTTLRAAKDSGRRAIGIEIDERYCEIAARRLSQEVFDLST